MPLYRNFMQAIGVTDGSNATTGYVGEYVATTATNGSATVTVTIASPGVVTWPSHGLTAGCVIRFTTTGALPTGLVAGTRYFVLSTGLTANDFQLSETAFGTAITTTGSQSGVHTAFNNVIITSATNISLGAIRLTAGDWDLRGIGLFATSGGTTSTRDRKSVV